MHYFSTIQRILEAVAEAEATAMRAAAERVATSLLAGGIWHVFGTGHSHMAGEEVYYRAGGLAPVNGICFPGLMQHEGPVTSTRLERLSGLADIILDRGDVRSGEVLTVVSNSGKNAVPVEVAETARRRGIQTIAITSLAASHATAPSDRQPARLSDCCDVVIDNHGVPGDACLDVPGYDLKTAATSTVVNSAILQHIVYEVCVRYADEGVEPPVFKSANQPGGDAWNAKLFEAYGHRVNFR